jgi:hypothetical protein
MFKKQGTSKRSASTSIGDIKPGFHEATPTDMGEQAWACDMTLALEELEHCEELSEVQLATVVGGSRRVREWLNYLQKYPKIPQYPQYPPGWW